MTGAVVVPETLFSFLFFSIHVERVVGRTTTFTCQEPGVR